MAAAELHNAYVGALHGTLSPAPDHRKRAELELKRLRSLPGFAPLALSIALNASEEPIRLASSLYFKNFIRQAYGDKDAIREEDKQQLRSNIVQAIVGAHPKIRSSLLLAFHFMLIHDETSDHLSAYLNVIDLHIRHHDLGAVFGGLAALQELVKLFTWRERNDRVPLAQIVKSVFPHLLSIANQAIAHNDEMAASILKSILKTYYLSVQMHLCRAHMDPQVLTPWFELFLAVLTKPLHDSLFPPNVDVEDKERHPLWKAKKWACHILNKLSSRYGNPKSSTFCSDKRYAAFAKHFSAHLAPTIATAYLEFVSRPEFVSSRCRYLAAVYLADAIKAKVTWGIIQPHAKDLLTHFIFPALCCTTNEIELLREDPIEFIHSRADPLEDYRSAKAGAERFLVDLSTTRRPSVFEHAMQLIHTVLAVASTDDSVAARKDGALHMLSLLSEACLSSNSPIRAQMEGFLVTYVLPELSSNFPFLRARAFATVADFAELDWNPANALMIAQAAFSVIISPPGTQDLSSSPILPVMVDALQALKLFLGNEHIHQALLPHVPQILQTMLQLQNVLEMDVLAGCMEEFVETFSAQVAPCAVDIASQLTSTFIRIMNEAQSSLQPHEVDNDDDDDFDFDGACEKTMTAAGCLKTLGTLILSVDDAPAIVSAIEVVMAPAILYVLDQHIIDLYSDVFELIDSSTFALKAISPIMWDVFTKLYNVTRADPDFFIEAMPAFDNFISYGHQRFAESAEHQRAFLDLITMAFTSADLGEADRVGGCQLSESFMLHLRGHNIDHLVSGFIAQAMAHLLQGTIKTKLFLVAALQTVLNAIYYNPILAIHILEEHGWTTPFFSLLMNSLTKFTRVHDHKLAIVALCALISVPLQSLPPSLHSSGPNFLAALASLFSTLPKAIEARREQERFYSGIPDAASANPNDQVSALAVCEDEIEDNDDDDQEWIDEDDEADSFLNATSRAPRSDSDSDDDDDELEEEMYLETPINSIDIHSFFKTTLANLQISDPLSYQALTAGMSPETQAVITQAIHHTSTPVPS